MTLPFVVLIIFFSSSINLCRSVDNGECINGLIAWIKHNGGDISDSIKIRYIDDISRRGVYSSNTLHSNDILASIPISLLFTLPDAQKLLKTVLPQNKKEALSKLGPIDTLSLALFIEYQNGDSFWNSYLKCLPTINDIKNELNMPLYWSESEINKYLQSSKVGLFIQRRIKSIHDSFTEINEILQNISYLKQLQFSMDEWIWALSIVWSRSFSVMIQHQKVKCLVPFGDLFNFNDNVNEINIVPMTWNQSQFAHDLMQYDVKSYTSLDGDNFIFEMAGNTAENVQLYAEYNVEVLPNFVIFVDYGFCIKNNPMDGIWITIEDILKSLKFGEKFRNNKIKLKSQKMMKKLVDNLQLGQIFVLRSMLSEYYMDISNISFENQKRFIEPYAFSLFLMSLVLNSKNDILLFGDNLLNFKQNYPQIKSNQDIMAVFVHILNNAYTTKPKKTVKLIKNTWNTINNYIKSQMRQFETSLIQDIMYREQLQVNEEIDSKLECGLSIRINEKIVLFSVWVQLQRLKKLLLSLIKT